MNSAFELIKWNCYRQLEKLGSIGILAIVVMIVALLNYFILVKPLQQTMDDESFNHSISPENKKQSEFVGEKKTQINRFLNVLPFETEKTSQVEQMIAIAKDEKLKLSAVNYHTKKEHSLLQSDMKFSVKSNYPEFKNFMNAVMYQFPNVAISALNMQRTKFNDQSIRANVHLTLYFRRHQ